MIGGQLRMIHEIISKLSGENITAIIVFLALLSSATMMVIAFCWLDRKSYR